MVVDLYDLVICIPILAVSPIFDLSPVASLFFKKINKMPVIQGIDDVAFGVAGAADIDVAVFVCHDEELGKGKMG